jgi:hypothetical protein
MNQADELRWATAYHEAGHCVVGLVTGAVPTRSSIVAGDNYEGTTWFDEEDVAALLGADPPREASEWYIIRAFAGPLAEHRYARDGAAPDVCEDYAPASAVLSRLTAEPGRLRGVLVARAEGILDEQWPAVERVAAALVEHLTIDRDAIRRAAHVRGGPMS